MKAMPTNSTDSNATAHFAKSRIGSLGIWIAMVGLTSVLGTGCEEEKPPEPKSEATQEATKEQLAAATVPPTPTPAAPVEAARPKTIDTELTSERRSTLEKAYPDAKGFILAKDIEEKLKKDTKNTAKAAALKSFDKSVKGKWVLFTGPLVNPTETGFDMAITYTPQAPNDPMGISRQFFTVTFSDVEGYAKDKFKAGNMVVVLAEYDGEGKAGPGHELIAAEKWE